MFIRRRSVLNDALVHHLTQKRTVWYPAQPVSTLLLKPVLFTHCSSSSSSSSIHETFYTSCSYTETVFIHFYTHVCMLNYVGWSFWCFSRSCDVMPPYLLHAGVKMCFGDSVVCNRFIYSCAFTQTMFFFKKTACVLFLYAVQQGRQTLESHPEHARKLRRNERNHRWASHVQTPGQRIEHFLLRGEVSVRRAARRSQPESEQQMDSYRFKLRNLFLIFIQVPEPLRFVQSERPRHEPAQRC